ncbi:MAG: glutamate--tRNA ligase [Firmicutes bacterium]|nr:glutamate--tRNA ligase [Bacillota bacterium]
MPTVRVRFAPSPTGELHIGGARTALFNWLFARQNNGVFILRIDDTDAERSREEYWTGIIEALNWLGLDWDEGPDKGGDYGPYVQSERYPSYMKEVNRLLETGKAYHCYCSKEKLERGREEARRQGKPYVYPGTCRKLDRPMEGDTGVNPVIRLRTPDTGQTVVHDLIREKVSFDNSILDDFIILKSDGVPTYNFASVVDDWEMKISHVIRAEEHLSNTPRQQLVADALGYDLPVYAHVPMILAPDRSKLSKRHGATSVQEFKNKGFLPEALINYLALLGWSPPGEEEILPLDRIVEYFSLDRVVKTAAIYDTKKIIWINGHYIRESSTQKMAALAIPFLQQANLLPVSVSNNDMRRVNDIFAALSDRVKTIGEFVDASTYFFKNDFDYDEDAARKILGKGDARENLKLFIEELKAMDDFSRDSIQEMMDDIFTKYEISPGRLNRPVRIAISGRPIGPELIDIILILGPDETIRRCEKALTLGWSQPV